MADFLDGMRIAARRRALAAGRRTPEAALRRRAAHAPHAPPLRLSPAGFDVIGEVKRRVPGTGSADRDPALPGRLAAAYAAGGAVAVSVLTEPLAFAGSLDDLALATRTLSDGPRPIPTMRKDFLVSPYQLFEARAAGAGGALIIADLLEPGAAHELLDAAAEAGLWVLVEAFSGPGLRRAERLATRADGLGVQVLLGINVRDLRTLEVDADRLTRLAPRRRTGHPVVAESGMRSPRDVARAARLGYRAALVGRALAAARDPRRLLEAMIRSGRAARQGTAPRGRTA